MWRCLAVLSCTPSYSDKGKDRTHQSLAEYDVTAKLQPWQGGSKVRSTVCDCVSKALIIHVHSFLLLFLFKQSYQASLLPT